MVGLIIPLAQAMMRPPSDLELTILGKYYEQTKKHPRKNSGMFFKCFRSLDFEQNLKN